MTALPDREAATSLVLMLRVSNRRRIASATAAASMIAPSTMLSGGTGSLPNPVTLYPLPAGLSSIALTALEPMSSPTRAFALRNTVVSSCSCLRCVSESSRGAGTHTRAVHDALPGGCTRYRFIPNGKSGATGGHPPNSEELRRSDMRRARHRGPGGYKSVPGARKRDQELPCGPAEGGWRWESG